MTYTRHILGEFDNNNRIQSCIICGEIIHDYRGAMYSPNSDGSPVVEKGWQEGDFFISNDTWPQFMSSLEPSGVDIYNCR